MPTLTFTSGNDSYVVNTASIYDLTFLAGDDTLTIQNAGATVTASLDDGNDVVSHKSGTADVTGGTGLDRFEVYASGLTADGGADADLFNIRGGNSLVLSGGLGNDRFNFYASSLNITLHGGDGDDDFFGYGNSISGSDPTGIYGDAGADYFVGFSGGLSIYGGTGNDIYRATAGSPATFVEAFGQGTDSVQVARGSSYTLPANIENISVSGFSGSTGGVAIYNGNPLANTINAHANDEELYGFAGSDRLAAKGGNDQLFGGDGNDSLDGGDGLDWLYGESGNDTLNGRAGIDHMLGGLGDDTYYVGGGDVVTEGFNEGLDTLRIGDSDYTQILPDNVENGILSSTASNVQLVGNNLDNVLIGNAAYNDINGNDGNDTVNGGGGDDLLYGYNNDDTVIGGAGNDLVRGNFGNDILVGGDGNDVLGNDSVFQIYEYGDDVLQGGNGDDDLFGYTGMDVLTGGAGSDDLYGGADADTFIYLAASDSVPFARDNISGFQTAAGGGADKIDLSAIDANSNVAGDQAFTLTAFPTGAAGQMWINDDGVGNIYLNCEIDGDLNADLQIHLVSTVGALAAADFVL